MKRYGNIYYRVVELDNIIRAIEKASKRKKKRKSVQRILANKEYYAEKIQRMLIDKTYVPSPYIEKKIYDGSRKKERIIYKPKFYPDQIIHWSIMLQLEPILKKRMYYYSCASIKHKGGKLAFKGTRKYVQKYKYCLKLDIKKFYPNINKERLKDKFLDVIKDKDVIWLLNLIVDSHTKGLPIGNYTSQWFANFYLTDLDMYIKEVLKVKGYIRYMDDMILFSNNKRELHKIKQSIEEYIKSEDLNLKENWQLMKIDDAKCLLDFLGYRFYSNHTTLRRCNFLRCKRRIVKVAKCDLTIKNASAIISYNGLLNFSNCHTFKEKYMYPYISLKKCKGVISNENRERNKTNTGLYN